MKDISEVCAFIILKYTVFRGKVNTRRISQPEMVSIFTKIYKIFWSEETKWIIRIVKIDAYNLLGRTPMHLFWFTNSAQRTVYNMYAEYTRPQLTFFALVPWKHADFKVARTRNWRRIRLRLDIVETGLSPFALQQIGFHFPISHDFILNKCSNMEDLTVVAHGFKTKNL